MQDKRMFRKRLGHVRLVPMRNLMNWKSDRRSEAQKMSLILSLERMQQLCASLERDVILTSERAVHPA